MLCSMLLALPPGGGELESVLATRSTLSKSGVVQAQFRLPLSLKYLFVNGIFCGLYPNSRLCCERGNDTMI